MSANGHFENERPIFILGVPRSGTTLLSFMLDSHPNIAVGRETNIMRGIKCLYGDAGDDDAPINKYVVRHWYERYGLTRDGFTQYARKFLCEFFGDYARKSGKWRWGEKTPNHTYYCDLMHEIFPKAQFIHIVRDPRAVACSRVKWKDTMTAKTIALEWQRENDRIAQLGARLSEEYYLKVRYEDLVLHPKSEAQRIIRYLGEVWDSSVLEHEQVASKKFVGCLPGVVDSSRTRMLDKRAVVEGGAENDPARKIDTASLYKWKMKLRKIQIAEVQRIARKGMEAHGYLPATGLIPLVGKVKVSDYA